MIFQLPSITSFVNKKALSFFLVLFSVVTLTAQEVIKDQPVKEVPKADSTKKMKVDGVIATVGDYIILDSDIDKAYLEISSQGGSTKDITRCQMLGKLMEDKLYAHQAVQDSVKVTDSEVKSLMDERLAYMSEQLGSMDKVVAYYKKNNEEEFRTYFFDILKENKLTSEMQKKIVDDVQITPEEVRNFFKKIPKDNKRNLSEKLAEILDNVNYLHPFREGNGRTQREFLRLLILEKDLSLNLNPPDNISVYERYMKGTIESDLKTLTDLIFELIEATE